MTKKILVLCVLFFFLSSTLYAQTVSFEQRFAAVEIASTSIREKLDTLIAQVDRGNTIRPGDLENIISELQTIDNDVSEISGDLQTLASDNSTSCIMIRWISLTWGAIGLLSTTSVLVSLLRLAIRQSSPVVLPTRHERKLVRQYLKCARKLIVAAVIVPVSLINVLLLSRQYRECIRANS